MKIHSLIIIICLLLISACGSSEKEARVLLNQAITEWDAGKIESSLALFDRINSGYIDTKTATEAIKEKTYRLEKYRQEYNPINSLDKNKGILSKLIIINITKYYTKYGVYPDALSELTVSLNKAQKYIPLCV